MGLLVDGNWQDSWYDTSATGGRFVRKETAFHHWITKDGGPGPTGRGGFAAESGRYHLYVSLACPWAHRTLIFRKLKQLENHISLSVVHWHMGSNGWEFVDAKRRCCGSCRRKRSGPEILAESIGLSYRYDCHPRRQATRSFFGTCGCDQETAKQNQSKDFGN